MKKTTFSDYHLETTEKREIERAFYISEQCGRSRYDTTCPFCGSREMVYAWIGHKRCSVCGAMLCVRICMAFKAKEQDR